MEKKEYQKLITDPSRIRRILFEHSLLEEPVEVLLDDTETFYLMQFVDEMTELDQEGVSEGVEKGPYAYLKKGEYLLLTALIHDNEQIPLHHGDSLRLRLFQGNSSFESDLTFDHVFEDAIDKKLIMRTSYPQQLGLTHTRRQTRFKVLSNSSLSASISTQDIQSLQVSLIDISAAGASFFTTLPPGWLLESTEVDITFHFPDFDDLTILSSARHCRKVSGHDTDQEHGVICGIEFIVLGYLKKVHINEAIAIIQRERLIKEKEDLLIYNRKLMIEVTQKTNQLREKDLQLLEMDRIVGIGSLAAGIAHEINNPLGFVKSSTNTIKKKNNKLIDAIRYLDTVDLSDSCKKQYTSYLKEIKFDSLADSVTEKFSRVLQGLKRIESIVKNLRGFSRLDQAEKAPIDINHSIDELIEVLQKKSELFFTIEKDFHDLPPLMCSPQEIHQCFLNIMQNAIDALEEHGMVTVMTRYCDKDNVILIIVEDDGQGMPPHIKRQIFNPFFTTKEVGAGTGVGLSMTERIIRRHGGKIDIQSKEHEGTTVTIMLPVDSERQ